MDKVILYPCSVCGKMFNGFDRFENDPYCRLGCSPECIAALHVKYKYKPEPPQTLVQRLLIRIYDILSLRNG